jgi:hypothetical protein
MALYCFGDSYTEGYKNDMRFWPYDAYREYLGLDDPKDMPPLWSDLLGDKLGVESYNYGKGGSSNHEILLRICEQSHKFKKDDIVIIGWTYIQRCLWVINEQDDNDLSNRLTSVSPQQGHHYDRDGLFKDAYDIIAVNRVDYSWTYEVLGYQKIIDSLAKSIGFKVYYWFADNFLFENLSKIEETNNEKYILSDLISDFNLKYEEDRLNCTLFDVLREYGAKTITEDSNGKGLDDMHLGGTGHKVQAELFYSYITKTPYPKKLEKYL